MIEARVILELNPHDLGRHIPAWLRTHVAPERAEDVERRVAEVLEGAPDDDLLALRDAFVHAGHDYRFYPADPLARRVSRAFLGSLIDGSTLQGREDLRAFLEIGPARRLIVANHCSYVDTQLTDAVLCAHAFGDVADRIVAIAGPKVYTDPFRRVAAIGLNTRKTAQSSTVATEQDALSPRQLAAIALETLADCERLMDEGYVPLLYPEGTRTRTGRLQPFLRAAARYLAIDGLQVLPLALTGSAEMFALDASRIAPGRVTLTCGPAFRPTELGPGRTRALEEAHARIAGLLPDTARPPSDAALIA
jgi:1-acyl-sn-glycerol-3-phosphate acyltransferase